MSDTRVLSNRRVTWGIGPDTAVADYSKPTLAELTALKNYSEAVKIDGTDFNISASDQADDRSFTDEAGAKTRSYTQFGGTIEGFTPKQADTNSVFRKLRDTVKTPRTKLALMQRFGKLNGLPVVAGDEISLFRVATDANKHNRSDTSYSYSINLVPRDDVLLNYIVPSAPATPVVVTPATPLSLTVAGVQLLKVIYQGRNITAGASYASSDEAVVLAGKNGVVYGVAAGTATVTINYPGSSAPVVITVTVA